MENTTKLKLLFSSRPGILLARCPETYQELLSCISHYSQQETFDNKSLIFTDGDGDECEILDDLTLVAALSECQTKLTISLKSPIPVQPSPNSHNIPIQGRRILKFFKSNTRRVALFDMETEKLQWVKMPHGIQFRQYASWVDLPSGEVFYCGGGHPVTSSDSYIINLELMKFRAVKSMPTPRHSHGVIYNNGEVLVFGGYQNILFFGALLGKCERYVVDRNEWEDISDMDSPRGDVGVTQDSQGQIYLYGKGSTQLIQYNSNRFQLELGEDEGGCIAIKDGLAYVFQGRSLKIYNLSERRLTEEVRLPQHATWWSHCPPEFYNNYIYFVYWKEPGWICRYDIENRQFVQLIALN